MYRISKLMSKSCCNSSNIEVIYKKLQNSTPFSQTLLPFFSYIKTSLVHYHSDDLERIRIEQIVATNGRQWLIVAYDYNLLNTLNTGKATTIKVF